MKAIAVAIAVALGLAAPALVPALVPAAAQSPSDKIRAVLESWLASRAGPEGVSGVAAAVSLPDSQIIEAFAGRVGKSSGDAPVTKDTLFQIGSVTKSMTAAVLLTLEASGRLSIDDTVGKWLDPADYEPAWKDVSIRRLLDMTAPIPTYSETEAISQIWISQPTRVLSARELVGMVKGKGLPTPSGWFYSNTNYILAGMIAAKAGGQSLPWLMREQIFRPLGLDSTFYEETTYPDAVMARLAHGYFLNPACSEYQPDNCASAWNKPLIGRDVRTLSLSWAQAAGGAISNARDVARWARAIFEPRPGFMPSRQQSEWQSLVSQATGKPIDEVSDKDPKGFALGLGRVWRSPTTAFWYYEGETLGYRTMYVWFDAANIAVVVQTNSQPKGDDDKIADAVMAIYDVVTPFKR